MSISAAHLMLVPAEPSFVPPPGTARQVAVALHARAFFLSEFVEHPPVRPPELEDLSGTRFRMYPREPQVPIARFFDDYSPFSIVVEEFKSPTDVADETALRYCGNCGALVETLAVCAACGVEEDPSEWRLGPAKGLYTRALEIGIIAEGGLDIWEKSDQDVERALRNFFGDTVRRLEESLGISLRLVRYVEP